MCSRFTVDHGDHDGYTTDWRHPVLYIFRWEFRLDDELAMCTVIEVPERWESYFGQLGSRLKPTPQRFVFLQIDDVKSRPKKIN